MAERKDLNLHFLSGAILLLIAALYFLLSYFTPFAYDDYVFMAEWRATNGEKALSISTLYDFWKDIRLYDNGRLANTFSILSTTFSPWKEIFPIATGLLVATIIFFTAYFSFPDKKISPFYISVVWCAVLFFLPWRNALFVADYSLNYIWSAAITMLFMVMLVRSERYRWNFYNFIFTILLAVLAGGWHEGFAIPTLFGFLLFTIKKKFKFSPYWYIAGFIYGVVALVFLYCPGLIGRSQRQLGVANTGQSYLKMTIDFLPVIFISLIVVFSSVVPPLRRRLKKVWNNIWFVTGTGIVVAGSLLSLLFTHQARSSFWPDLMAIVMIFIITAPLWRRLNISRYKYCLTSVSLAACVTVILTTIIWQFRLYKESEAIMAKMESSNSGTIYHDIIRNSDIPVATLKMTNYPAWITDFHYHALKEYMGKPFPAVLPTALEQADIISEGRPLKGNAGAVNLKNHIIIPANLFGKPITLEADMLLKNGEEIPGAALLLPFLTKDNQEMAYMVVYGFSVEDIEGISI